MVQPWCHNPHEFYMEPQKPMVIQLYIHLEFELYTPSSMEVLVLRCLSVWIWSAGSLPPLSLVVSPAPAMFGAKIGPNNDVNSVSITWPCLPRRTHRIPGLSETHDPSESKHHRNMATHVADFRKHLVRVEWVAQNRLIICFVDSDHTLPLWRISWHPLFLGNRSCEVRHPACWLPVAPSPVRWPVGPKTPIIQLQQCKVGYWLLPIFHWFYHGQTWLAGQSAFLVDKLYTNRAFSSMLDDIGVCNFLNMWISLPKHAKKYGGWTLSLHSNGFKLPKFWGSTTEKM